MGGSSGGVAVLLKNHIPYSRHNQLEDTSVDDVVLTVRLSAIKLVVSTAYVRPDDFEGLKSTKMLYRVTKRMLTKTALRELFSLVISMPIGETNRVADHFSILNDGEPTFLAANGCGVIDLCICYGPLFDSCKHSLSTDEFAELFTVAPQRGHVPVFMRLERSSITEKIEKLWIEKADWVGWTSFIEG